MKLTDQNRSDIKQLIQAQKWLYRLRHVYFAFGFICTFIAFGGLFYFLAMSNRAAFDAWASHPIFYLTAAAGGIAFGLSHRGKRGDPHHRLLISVVEELSKDEKEKA